MTGNPSGVDIGGVDEIQARVEGGVEQPEGIGFVDGPAKDVAAQHDDGNFNSGLSEFSFLHFVISSF